MTAALTVTGRVVAERGNAFLDALDPEDFALLAPDLRRVTLEQGRVLVAVGDVVDKVHFPITAQLANTAPLSDGPNVETGLIGREGMSGLAPVLSNCLCGWQIHVRLRGEAWTASAAAVRRLFDMSASFRSRALKLTYFYQLQSSQGMACNARHNVTQRVARWLLTARDLSGAAALTFTQADMALLLGSQRTSVVQAFGHLKASRAIRHTRGRIQVQDEAALRRHACECFGFLQGMGATCDPRVVLNLTS